MSASEGDDDLPDEVSRRLEAPRLEGGRERDDAVDDRLDAVGLNRAVHLLEHRARADTDAAQRRFFPHDAVGIERRAAAGQYADETHLAPVGHRRERSLQRADA